MRHSFPTMGTVATLDLAGHSDLTGPMAASAVIEAIERLFAEADRRFSLYRPDSELHRISQGSLRLVDSSEELREVYASAIGWRAATNGAFSPHRPDGIIDLNGIVKAWAMDRAARWLESAGVTDCCLTVGGDLVFSGEQGDGSPWTIGIVDPADRTKLLCSLLLSGGQKAMATSGSAERGDHIWLAGSNERAEYLQVTVVAHDIVTADVLATAIVSGGEASRDQVTEGWPVDVLTVDRDGNLTATPGLVGALASDPRSS